MLKVRVTRKSLSRSQRVRTVQSVRREQIVGVYFTKKRWCKHRDMIRFLAEESEAILEMPVSTFMTRNVVTVPSETPLEECMQIMINRNFRHLLVMEDAKFLGIISMRDMVSTLLKDRDTLIQDLEKYITGSR